MWQWRSWWPARHLRRGEPDKWTDCQIQLFCVSISSRGSIVEAGQADPTSCIQLSSLPCMRVSLPLLPGWDFIVFPLFQIRRLECYTDQGKIINCPFVLASISTGQNKLMVMKPYRMRFRRWVWCDLPSCSVQPPSRDSPLWAQGLQPARSPEHKCCCVFHCFPTLHSSYQHLQTNNTHRMDVESSVIISFWVLEHCCVYSLVFISISFALPSISVLGQLFVIESYKNIF